MRKRTHLVGERERGRGVGGNSSCYLLKLSILGYVAIIVAIASYEDTIIDVYIADGVLIQYCYTC